MPTNELTEILSTVESLRRELHPELDPDLVKAVVVAEEANPEDDAEALRAIRAIVERVLSLKKSR